MLLISKVGCINCYSLKVLKELRKILIDHVIRPKYVNTYNLRFETKGENELQNNCSM